MSLYSLIAEQLQFVVPNFYKERFFKKLKKLNKDNVLNRKVEPELVWIKHFLTKDSVFIDIGANVGAYVYTLESILKPKNIYAFEPNLSLYKRLMRIFPNINACCIALSNENTEAEFKIPIMNGKKILSRGTLQKDLKEQNEVSSVIYKVKVMKFDSWIAQQNIQGIDFIKIDVEGNELHTLLGAKESIKKYKPVLMVEIEQRHHEFPIWDIIEEVKNWGYQANFLNREDLQLHLLKREFLEQQNAEQVKVYENYINNIIFLPE